MTDKELRRLSRSELLEMLIAQTAEKDHLKTRLEQAEAQLLDRRIAIPTRLLVKAKMQRPKKWVCPALPSL